MDYEIIDTTRVDMLRVGDMVHYTDTDYEVNGITEDEGDFITFSLREVGTDYDTTVSIHWTDFVDVIGYNSSEPA